MASVPPPPSSTEESEQKQPEEVEVLWQESLRDQLKKTVSAGAKELGMFPELAEAYVDTAFPALLQDIHKNIFGAGQGMGAGFDARISNFTSTAGGLQTLGTYGLNWMAARVPGFSSLLSTSRGAGGGSGRRGPTAAEIRASFDLDQLASQASDMWRGMLVEEPSDPRGIARAYVDAVVKSGGKKKIDYGTFVENRIKSTARYSLISKGKPEGMDYMTYLAPFINSANQILGGNQGRGGVSGVIGNAAALGADPQSFRQRLARSDTVTGSAPFINSLQEKVAGVSRVLS